MTCSTFHSMNPSDGLKHCRADIPSDVVLSAENIDYVGHFYGTECVDALLKQTESPVLTAHRMLMGQ